MADTDVTAQTIIDSSIARARDEDEIQWSDSELLIYLNKGVDFVHKLLIRIQSEIAVSSDDITMVAATQEYTLSGNIDNFWAMAENGVYYAGTGEFLTPATHEDKIRAASATTDTYPTAYYITSTNIGLIDIPTATSVALYPTLTCRNFKKNTSLAVGDSMPYKNLFNEPLSSFMDHMAILRKGKATAEFTALYNALEASALEIANRRVPT